MAVCEEDACSSTGSVESPSEERLLLLCPRKGDESVNRTGSSQLQSSGPSMQNGGRSQAHPHCPPWKSAGSFTRVQELCQWLGCLLLMKIDQCKFGGKKGFSTTLHKPCKPVTAKLVIGLKSGPYRIKFPNKHLFDYFARQCELWEFFVGTEYEWDRYLLYDGRAMAKVLGMDLAELPAVTVSQYNSKEHCRGVEVKKLELMYHQRLRTIQLEVFCTPYFGQKQCW